MGSKYNGLKVIPTGLLGLLLITMMHGPTFWADGMRGFTSGAVSPAPVTILGISSNGLELSASLNATTISKQEVIGIDLSLTNLGRNITTVWRGRDFVKSLIYVYAFAPARLFSSWILSPNCSRLSGKAVPFNLQPNVTLVLTSTIYWPTTEWCYWGSDGPGNLSAVIPGSYVMEIYYPDITLTPILITVNQETSLIWGFIAESDLTLILLAAATTIILLNVVVTLLLRSEIRKMKKEHVLEERDAKTKNVNDKS